MSLDQLSMGMFVKAYCKSDLAVILSPYPAPYAIHYAQTSWINQFSSSPHRNISHSKRFGPNFSTHIRLSTLTLDFNFEVQFLRAFAFLTCSLNDFHCLLLNAVSFRLQTACSFALQDFNSISCTKAASARLAFCWIIVLLDEFSSPSSPNESCVLINSASRDLELGSKNILRLK